MTDTLVVNLPDDIAAELERLAREEGLTAEQMLVRIAERQIRGFRSAREYFEERAKRADWGAFERVFGTHREGGEPPRPGDEVD